VRRAPWSFLWLAIAVRALVAVRTEVPGRDGVSYLWMAEAFARGDFGALFHTVFHPLYPALVGGLLWACPVLDAVVAGQLVASGLAAIAVVPLWAVAGRLFGPMAATATALAYATGAWFARHPAECMSEGPFYLCVATWAHALLGERPRPARAGVAAGLAFLLRPEGALLLAVGGGWLLAARRARAAATLAAVALPIMALLPAGYAICGDGFTLTPKATFNYEVGVGGATSPWLHYLGEACKLPLAAWEELGWLWLPLAIAGAIAKRPRGLAAPATLLLVPFVLQCAVVPLLQSHWRFLSGYGVLLLPFAGVAAAGTWKGLAARGRALPWLFVALLAAADVRVFGARNADRAVERDLGRWLAHELGPGEFVVSDMPRLDFFAGQQPPPPRPITADDVLRRAASPQCRFVVLVVRRGDTGDRRRTDVDDSALSALGLEPMLPPAILSAADERSLRLFARTRTR